MAGSRCPHCATALPEAATFCAACGRRIEGWSALPKEGGPASLPGGEEPTRQVDPTPSLLRAVALSKGGSAPAAAPAPAQGPAAGKGPAPAPSVGATPSGMLSPTESAMLRVVRRR